MADTRPCGLFDYGFEAQCNAGTETGRRRAQGPQAADPTVRRAHQSQLNSCFGRPAGLRAPSRALEADVRKIGSEGESRRYSAAEAQRGRESNGLPTTIGPWKCAAAAFDHTSAGKAGSSPGTKWFSTSVFT